MNKCDLFGCVTIRYFGLYRLKGSLEHGMAFKETKSYVHTTSHDVQICYISDLVKIWFDGSHSTASVLHQTFM